MAASSTTFQRGKSGNPSGRQAGARNKASLALEMLLDGEAEAITRKAVEMAKAGDTVALRLCLERIIPVRRDRPIQFELPPIETMADLTKATSALLAAVAAGDLTPSEAAELGKLVDAHVRAVEVTDIHERLARIEGAAVSVTSLERRLAKIEAKRRPAGDALFVVWADTDDELRQILADVGGSVRPRDLCVSPWPYSTPAPAPRWARLCDLTDEELAAQTAHLRTIVGDVVTEVEPTFRAIGLSDEALARIALGRLPA